MTDFLSLFYNHPNLTNNVSDVQTVVHLSNYIRLSGVEQKIIYTG